MLESMNLNSEQLSSLTIFLPPFYLLFTNIHVDILLFPRMFGE